MNDHYKTNTQLKEITAVSIIHPFLWNTIKYIVRYDKKGTALPDLEKAKDYIKFAIQMADKDLLVCDVKDKTLLQNFIHKNDFSKEQKQILKLLFNGKKYNYPLLKTITERIDLLKWEIENG